MRMSFFRGPEQGADLTCSEIYGLIRRTTKALGHSCK
jgi:hypothetical protein